MRLEPELWDALLEICQRERQDINHLVRQIEAEGHSGGRTSSVRVYVMQYFRTAASETGHEAVNHGALDRIAGRPYRRHAAESPGVSAEAACYRPPVRHRSSRPPPLCVTGLSAANAMQVFRIAARAPTPAEIRTSSRSLPGLSTSPAACRLTASPRRIDGPRMPSSPSVRQHSWQVRAAHRAANPFRGLLQDPGPTRSPPAARHSARQSDKSAYGVNRWLPRTRTHGPLLVHRQPQPHPVDRFAGLDIAAIPVGSTRSSWCREAAPRFVQPIGAAIPRSTMSRECSSSRSWVELSGIPGTPGDRAAHHAAYGMAVRRRKTRACRRRRRIERRSAGGRSSRQSRPR